MKVVVGEAEVSLAALVAPESLTARRPDLLTRGMCTSGAANLFVSFLVLTKVPLGHESSIAHLAIIWRAAAPLRVRSPPSSIFGVRVATLGLVDRPWPLADVGIRLNILVLADVCPGDIVDRLQSSGQIVRDDRRWLLVVDVQPRRVGEYSLGHVKVTLQPGDQIISIAVDLPIGGHKEHAIQFGPVELALLQPRRAVALELQQNGDVNARWAVEHDSNIVRWLDSIDTVKSDADQFEEAWNANAEVLLKAIVALRSRKHNEQSVVQLVEHAHVVVNSRQGLQKEMLLFEKFHNLINQTLTFVGADESGDWAEDMFDDLHDDGDMFGAMTNGADMFDDSRDGGRVSGATTNGADTFDDPRDGGRMFEG